MSYRILAVLEREERYRLARSCAPDGRPLAHLVFFEPDAWQLPEGYDDLLADHAHYLSAHPEARAVVSGHSYGSGSHRFYWLMGDRRALEVRQRLIHFGARAEQLLVQSRGAARSSMEAVDETFGYYRRRVSINHVGKAGATTVSRAARPGSAQWWRSVFGDARNDALLLADDFDSPPPTLETPRWAPPMAVPGRAAANAPHRPSASPLR